MKTVLVRIGIDQAYGGWNTPIDLGSGQFVYVPIPEGPTTEFIVGQRRHYGEILSRLSDFLEDRGNSLTAMKWPRELDGRAMHLDPDFEHLTDGNDGGRRGARIAMLGRNDLLVFYAGLRSIQAPRELVYALVGILTVDEVVLANSIPSARRDENAHTRNLVFGDKDIVVRGIPEKSGRFRRAIPMGKYRDRAYRVKQDILDAWGDLDVSGGFIQRSIRPPFFSEPIKFLSWFEAQGVELMRSNNQSTSTDRVVIVHLRRSKRGDPKEMRSDPFWEFGSFGWTGWQRHSHLPSKSKRRPRLLNNQTRQTS